MRSRMGILPRERMRAIDASPPPASAWASSSSMTAICSSTSSRFLRNCSLVVSTFDGSGGASNGVLMDASSRVGTGVGFVMGSPAQRRGVAGLDDVVAAGAHQRLGAVGVGEDVEAVLAHGIDDGGADVVRRQDLAERPEGVLGDRKSTRLNSR